MVFIFQVENTIGFLKHVHWLFLSKSEGALVSPSWPFAQLQVFLRVYLFLHLNYSLTQCTWFDRQWSCTWFSQLNRVLMTVMGQVANVTVLWRIWIDWHVASNLVQCGQFIACLQCCAISAMCLKQHKCEICSSYTLDRNDIKWTVLCIGLQYSWIHTGFDKGIGAPILKDKKSLWEKKKQTTST